MQRFRRTEESMIQILNFSKIINISKTKITPIANTKFYNLDQIIKNIQITNQNDSIKILGIYFTNDL